MPSNDNILNLSIRADSKLAVAGLEKVNKAVADMCANINNNIDGTVRGFEKLNAVRLNKVTREIGEMSKQVEKLSFAFRYLNDMAGKSAKVVMSVGTAAGKAGAQVAKLGGNAVEASKGLADIGEAGDAAKAGLTGISGEAKAAGTSISGLGRAAGTATTKLEGLSAVKFDTAGIVRGADAATVALTRTAEAGLAVKGAVRGAASTNVGMVRGGGAAAAERGSMGLAAAGALGRGALTSAAIVTAGAGMAAWNSAKFDSEMAYVVANTNMNKAQAAIARAVVMSQLGTGANAQELERAEMRQANFGYRNVLPVTTRLAMGTYEHSGTTEQTTEAVAGMMRAWNAPDTVAAAKKFANILHAAAVPSNMDLNDYVRNSQRTMAMAAAWGVRPEEAAAMQSALVQHRISPSRADTQVSGLIYQMVSPTPKSAKFAESIGLGGIFNAQGVKDLGPMGVLAQVSNRLSGMSLAERGNAVRSLFNNRQGGLGATMLMGQAAPAYNQIYAGPQGTNAAAQGRTDFTTTSYNNRLASDPILRFKADMGKLNAELIPIGEKLIPTLERLIPLIGRLADAAMKVLDGFSRLPASIQNVFMAAGAIGMANMATGGLMMSGGGGFMRAALPKLGIGGAAAGAGEAAGIGAALPVIAAVTAAIAALALAWKTNLGNIRQVTASVIANVTGFFKTNMPEIQETVRTVLKTMQEFWRDHGKNIKAIWSNIWKAIGTVVTTALNIIEGIFKVAMDIINGHWANGLQDLLKMGQRIMAGLRGIMSNLVQAVVNILLGLIGDLADLAQRVVVAAIHIGESIVQGIWKGMQGAWGWLETNISGMASNVLNTFNSVLRMQSPSKEFMKAGVNIAEGLIKGMDSKHGDVTAAAERMAKATIITRTQRARAAMDPSSSGYRSASAALSNKETWELAGVTQWAADKHADAKEGETQADGILKAAITKINAFHQAVKQEAAATAKAAHAAVADASAMDRVIEAQSRIGLIGPSGALAYYQNRLAGMGDPHTFSQNADKMNEYAEIADKIKQAQDQIAEGYRSGAQQVLDSITQQFELGAISASEYQKQLQGLQDTLKFMGNPAGTSGISTEITRKINSASKDSLELQRGIIEQNLSNGYDASGGKYGKAEARAALQAILKQIPDSQAGFKESIIKEIDSLKDDPKVNESAKEFWTAFMEPADRTINAAIDNIFKPGKKRLSGNKLWKMFAEDETNSMLKLGEKALTHGLYSKDPNSVGGMLGKITGGVFGNKGIQGGQGVGSIFSNVGNIFKGVKGSLVEGATALYGAAQAIANATGAGGKKRKFGGILGGIVGAIAGSYAGDPMGGFSLGSNIGNMLPFASGGVVPGVGNRDSVPAILTPGEIVIPKALSAALLGGNASGGTITSHFYGPINEASDLPRIQREMGTQRERLTRPYSTIPTTV